MFIEADQREIWTRAADLGKIIAAVLFGTFWLALGGRFRLQRVISGPLLRLDRHHRVVTRDAATTSARCSGGGDEIGELIDGFNEMLAEIQQRDRRCSSNQEHLEDTVEARTAELGPSTPTWWRRATRRWPPAAPRASSWPT